MGTAARLDAHDPFFGESTGNGQKARVFFGIDVVGNGAEIVSIAEALAKCLCQRGFTGTDGTTNADAEGAVG